MASAKTIVLTVALAILAFPGAAEPAQVSRAPNATQTDLRNLLTSPARLRVDRVRLGDALEELARASGVPLAYSPSLLPAERRVTCACSSLSVGDALTALLAGTGFQYREGEGQVILMPRPVMQTSAQFAAPAVDLRSTNGAALGLVRSARDEPLPPIEIPAPMLVLVATIRGTVTSEGGSPVVGATVTSVRTRLSALTDAAGNYRIVVPTERILAGPDTLRVERLGFAVTQVPYELSDGDIRVDVTLPLEAVALDQIVVTGTAGNQERRAQAAVVGSIDAADLVRQAPVSNVSQLLQARIPGLTITESSGTTGAASRINIRGAASISLSNQPLVFLDGVRIDGGTRGLVNVSGSATVGQAPSALNDLNPEDIESIEVVKGPAAATLYGADASAGVIQIITKKGRVGSRTFSQELTFEYDRIDPNFTVPTNYARCSAAFVAPTSPNPLCRGQTVGALISDNPAERIDAFRDGSLGSFRYNARGGGENYASSHRSASRTRMARRATTCSSSATGA